MLNQILLGDCYELMKDIPDGSIDLVLTDPPYNTTACDWDQQPIDLTLLWENIKRVLKPKGAVVMTGSQPFTTDLIMSNRKWFRYCLVWEKNKPANILNANREPLKTHEDIIIFGNSITYNPQKIKVTPYKHKNRNVLSSNFGRNSSSYNPQGYTTYDEAFLKSVLYFPKDHKPEHSTQKPINLFQYLTLTFSNPGETVLDPFAGSGTTAIAAHNTGRQFICFEKEQKYWQIANKRLELVRMQGRFDEMVG